MRRGDVPIVEYIAFNGKTVGQICGKHSRGSPAVNCPSINRIRSVGIPHGCEVRSVIVGAVFVLSEFKSAARSFQQPPICLLIKLGEVGDSILERGIFAVSADRGGYLFVNAIAGFHRSARCGWVLFITGDSHIRIHRNGIGIRIKLPFALIFPIPVILPVTTRCAVRIANSMPAPARNPYPIRNPSRSPNAPRGRSALRLTRN